MTARTWRGTVALLVALALTTAACGGGSSKKAAGGPGTTAAGAKRGGTLVFGTSSDPISTVEPATVGVDSMVPPVAPVHSGGQVAAPQPRAGNA